MGLVAPAAVAAGRVLNTLNSAGGTCNDDGDNDEGVDMSCSKLRQRHAAHPRDWCVVFVSVVLRRNMRRTASFNGSSGGGVGNILQHSNGRQLIRTDMASASAKKASTHAAAQKALLDEIKQLVDPVTGSRSKAPDAVNELHSSLHPRLVDLESFQELVHAPRPPTVDRALALSRLEDWLRVEAPQSMLGDSFQIALVGADGAQGATLVAVRDLSPGELFVRVPRSAIMSAESAMQSRFGMFV